MLDKGDKVSNYQILRKLGAGGFGVTYQARDLDLGHDVAIKEYFPGQYATVEDGLIVAKDGCEEEFEQGRRDFLYEARRLARFKHPNIVGVSRFLEFNNTAYIVMNFIAGRSLLEWLQEIEDGPPPTQTELDVLAEALLNAMELIHKNQMLHRDIKLSNVMISDEGKPVLIDFGAARESAGRRSRDVGMFVSPPYTPVEMYSMENRNHGPWSDIYSMAVVFYYCMTGVDLPVAPDRERDDVLAMPSPEDGYRPQFIVGLEAALNVNWRERPQSVAEWRERLFTKTSLDRAKTTREEGEIFTNKGRFEWFTWFLQRVVRR